LYSPTSCSGLSVVHRSSMRSRYSAMDLLVVNPFPRRQGALIFVTIDCEFPKKVFIFWFLVVTMERKEV
jgi:hypothetical protein